MEDGNGKVPHKGTGNYFSILLLFACYYFASITGHLLFPERIELYKILILLISKETEEESAPGESPVERISVRKKRTIPVPEAARFTLATRRPPPPPPTSQTIRPQSPSSPQLQPQSPSSPTFTSSTLPRPSRPAPVRVPHPASSPSLLSTSPVSVSPSLLSVSPSHVSSLPCTPPHSPRIDQIPLTTTTTTTITPSDLLTTVK